MDTVSRTKEPYGVLLIILLVRMTLGAFYGVMTVIAAMGPFSAHAELVVLLMAGELANVPAVILFVLRRPSFPLSFLIATILHTAGGIVLSTSSVAALASQVLAAQTGLFIPVVIFDVLMLVYLARSKKARAVFKRA